MILNRLRECQQDSSVFLKHPPIFSRSRIYSVASRILPGSSSTFEDSRISGIPSGMKDVLLFIVSPIAVKIGQAIPQIHCLGKGAKLPR